MATRESSWPVCKIGTLLVGLFAYSCYTLNGTV